MSHSRSNIVAVRQVLSKIAYVTQASLFAWEQGIVVDDTMGGLPHGQVLMDLAFRRRAAARREPQSSARRGRRHRGWGIQEAHLKRLIIMTRPH